MTTGTPGNDIEWRGVTHQFRTSKGPRVVLEDIDLSIGRGSIVTLIGPSGCGKTTLMKLAAGFEQASAGTVHTGGEEVRGLRAGIGYITQESNLYPWMTLRQNVEFPLEVLGVEAGERRRRADRMIKMVALDGFEDNYPHQLSGGMQKRASIIRTMVYEPEIVLMDEPFVGLDSPTRMTLFSDLLRLWQETGSTMLLVTHDLSEAITLSDEIVVMTRRPGKVKDRFPVGLSRPRDVFDIAAQDGYVETYERIWDSLKTEVLPSSVVSETALMMDAREDSVSGAPQAVAGPTGDLDRSALAAKRAAVARKRAGRAVRPARHPDGRTVAALQIALIAVILVLWEMLTRAGVLSELLYSSPLKIVRRLVDVLGGEVTQGNTVWDNLAMTLKEIGIGYAIGAVAGVALGFVIARVPLLTRVLEPMVLAVQGIPKIALAPLFILILGIGIESKIGVVVMEVFFMVFFNTLNGVMNVHEDHVRLARIFGADGFTVFRKVFVPSALPSILTGLKMGVPFAMTGAIIGEFISATSGLGWYVHQASSLLDASGLFVGIILILVVIWALGLIVRLAERVLLRWRPSSVSNSVPLS